MAGNGSTTVTGGILNTIGGGGNASNLVINNTATTTLSGLSSTPANNYTGLTTVNAGTLRLNTGDVSLTGGLTLGGNTTVAPVTIDIDGVNAAFGGPLTMNINSGTASTITVDPTKVLSIGGNVQIGANTPAVANTVTNLTITGGGDLNVVTGNAGTFLVGGGTIGGLAQDTTLDLTVLHRPSSIRVEMVQFESTL